MARMTTSKAMLKMECLGRIRALSLSQSSSLNQASKLPVKAIPPMNRAEREMAIWPPDMALAPV